MYEITLLTALAGAFIVLIISPGPNFLVITQLSFSQSRQQGICAGLGVASGSILWALLAATGLGLVFQQLPWLQPTLQLLGGAYLTWLGSKSLRSAGSQPKPRDIAALGIGSLSRAYRFGLLTNLTNPKALAFYTSVFTTVTRRACRCGYVLRGYRSSRCWRLPGSCCSPRCFRSPRYRRAISA